jgi:hypothetical protein
VNEIKIPLTQWYVQTPFAPKNMSF